ncbi:hypothetical protein BDN71DRAFT_811773 [Pleurotus eryngii]|uniref:Uncharacterized protein n=1 Tax=Pleurotus eryngii TaxID=5323 RepID=A0A9P5ZXH2_PLEER|nr:hypothetical protein BDN71DRAFT_811773 [Pleurotus eryngii]
MLVNERRGSHGYYRCTYACMRTTTTPGSTASRTCGSPSGLGLMGDAAELPTSQHLGLCCLPMAHPGLNLFRSSRLRLQLRWSVP